MLVLPVRSGVLYLTNAQRRVVPLCDITLHEPIVTVAVPSSAMLVLTARKIVPVYIISVEDAAKYGYCVREIAGAVSAGTLSLLPVSDTIAQVFMAALGFSAHPLAELMAAFKGISRDHVTRLITTIVDPRLFMPNKTGALTKTVIKRMLAYLGITSRLISQLVMHRVECVDKRVDRAVCGLHAWYHTGRARELGTKSIGMAYPQPGGDGLAAIDDYFWRYWHNRRVAGKSPAAAAYETTKRVCDLLFRLWGHWLGMYNFQSRLYFRYKCEQQWFAEVLDAWQRSALSVTC